MEAFVELFAECQYLLNLAKNLRAILRLFISANNRNQVLYRTNMEEVDSIESINAKPVDRLINGGMFRGYDIVLGLRGDHFERLGSLFMFCSILERFFGGYVTLHCFVRLTVEEIGKGHRFEWPARFGDRFVL